MRPVPLGVQVQQLPHAALVARFGAERAAAIEEAVSLLTKSWHAPCMQRAHGTLRRTAGALFTVWRHLHTSAAQPKAPSSSCRLRLLPQVRGVSHEAVQEKERPKSMLAAK